MIRGHGGRKIAVSRLNRCIVGLIGLAVVGAAQTAAAAALRHSVILFVPDGLRSGIVTPETAPTFSQVRDKGVNFTNGHSLFPTFTTANASAFATGHYLGDTGDFSNTIYTGFPVPGAAGSVTPFLENDQVLGDMDEHFAGNYLNEKTILAAARGAGFLTAAVGKLGPAAIQDVTARTGAQTIVVDDSTGRDGIPLPPEITAALSRAGLPAVTPPRGANGDAGDMKTPGTKSANVAQQKYFAEVATKVILPRFALAGRPFVLVFWSRDPDGTQHTQGDSLGEVVPGINGPTSIAAIRNADDNLAQIMAALRQLGLDETTDVIVAADHGFSTIAKESKTSLAAQSKYSDVPANLLPQGFLAMDLAQALALPLNDPDAKNAPVDPKSGQHPRRGNGLIGRDPAAPDVVVAANGGSDLIYLPQGNAKELAPRVVAALLAEDYVSGLFVDDKLGKIPGALPLSAVNLAGTAVTPRPAIVVNFRSFDTGCGKPPLCAAVVADTGLQQGQGMHGSLSRADTWNFMAAIGPDFKSGYVDEAPASNADIAMTMARLLRIGLPRKGKLVGRVLSESFKGGKPVAWKNSTVVSAPAENGLRTVLNMQSTGGAVYFDAAGFEGRTVGLNPPPP